MENDVSEKMRQSWCLMQPVQGNAVNSDNAATGCLTQQSRLGSEVKHHS